MTTPRAPGDTERFLVTVDQRNAGVPTYLRHPLRGVTLLLGAVTRPAGLVDDFAADRWLRSLNSMAMTKIDRQSTERKSGSDEAKA